MWQHDDMSGLELKKRLTAEEYLAEPPDAFGDIEVVDGLVVYNMPQSELHSRVIRRLSTALEVARPADGPCFVVSSDVAVRFVDADNPDPERRLNVRYPDIFVRDCDPYDVNTVRNHIVVIVEVASEATFKTDAADKRIMYATAGIPCYLIVHFDKDWERISEIEENRIDWSGRRYVPHALHRGSLILEEPFPLTVPFEDLQRP
jgi:Uma2 family endonuclease